MATATAQAAAPSKRGYAIGGVITLGLAGGIISAEPAISNVAIVGASRELGMSAAAQALSASIATLILAATIIALASWSDRIGRRNGLWIGLSLILLGDVLSGLSISTAMFLLARVITGLGSALVLATSFSMLKSVVSDPKKLGAALGIWCAFLYISPTIVAGIGGVLNNVSWRYAFFAVPVFCVVLILLSWKLTPNSREIPEGRMDFIGLAVLALGMILTLLGLSKASDSLTAPGTWIPFLLGLVFLVAFYFVERKVKNPAFPVEILKNPIFVGALIAGVMWNLTEAAFLFQTSLFWQYVYEYAPFKVLLSQIPLTLAAIVSAFVVGAILSKGKRPRSVILVGCVIMLIAFVGISFYGTDTSYWIMMPFIALAGVGIITVATPQAGLFVAHAPKKFLGAVTASRAATGQLGYAVGLAGGAALMSVFVKGNFHSALQAAHVPEGQWGSVLTQANNLLFKGEETHSAVQEQILHAAELQYANAFSTVMLVMAGIIVITGIAVTILLRKDQADESLGEMEEDEEALDAAKP